jgi:hypothetical protein
MSYPKPTPTCGTHVFLFYPHRSHLPPILSPFPLHSPTSPRPWTSRRRPRPSQRRTSPRRPPAPANRRSAGPRRPSPALCGVRRWASRSSRRRQPIVPSSAPCAGELSGPGGEKPQDGRSRAGPSMAGASGSKAGGSRDPTSSPAPLLLPICGGREVGQRSGGRSSSVFSLSVPSTSPAARRHLLFSASPPLSLLCDGAEQQPLDAVGSVAHALECALFGACGM